MHILNTLTSYVEALRPIIYINNYDFDAVDKVIAAIGSKADIVEYSNAGYEIDFKTKARKKEMAFDQYLDYLLTLEHERDLFIVMKDVHSLIQNPAVIARLKTFSRKTIFDGTFTPTIFVVSPVLDIPKELEHYVTIVDIPLPTQPEIVEMINEYTKDLGISITHDLIEELALDLKGLSEFQIGQVLNLAYQNNGMIDESDRKLILKEKEQSIRKSGQLEIVHFKNNMHEIGGLDNLKQWLKKKAVIFNKLEKAGRFGVDTPKGILIVGMPGCGKSLTAKATANLFKVSLLRLDVGRLLGKYLGESENNMRSALHLAEQMSPCVLWIDEIEKAFAGVGDKNTTGEVATRLFGYFLTWLQEKETSVFIIATANDITKLPVEFLRKGRFDELFFVDLPNEAERIKIIQIHLKKRNHWQKEIDLLKLSQAMEGYSGADIEAVVKEAIENAFITDKKIVTTEDIMAVMQNTKSISKTLGKKIKEAKEQFSNLDIKPASLNTKP